MSDFIKANNRLVLTPAPRLRLWPIAGRCLGAVQRNSERIT